MKKINLIFVIVLLTVQISFAQGKVSTENINIGIQKLEVKLDTLFNAFDNQTTVTKNKIDSVSIGIKDLEREYQLLLNEFNNQSRELEELAQMVVSPETNVFREFIYPIILSIIAAIIFWFAFSYIPERSRKRKIRSKIDLEIYQIYSRLFAVFDTIMKLNGHSPSDYQALIRGKKLSNRDIEIGLQNKCLNETYIFYPELIDKLLPIGKSLWKYEKKINSIIDRLFNFGMYLHPDEILLFENIRNKLGTYELEDFNRNAFSEIGGMKLHPINPSISYMTNNFNELYSLYSQLQDLVFSSDFENRDIFIHKVQYLFYSEQYEDTIKTIKRGHAKYPKDMTFLETYAFQSLYKLDKQNEAYKKLESIFETKPHLVSSRGSLKDYLSDKKIQELLNKYYSDIQLKELNEVIAKEDLKEQLFIVNAKQLEDFYNRKIKENSKK